MFRLNFSKFRTTARASYRTVLTGILVFVTCFGGVASAQSSAGAKPLGGGVSKAHVSSFTTAGGHTITFHGVSYDFDSPGESTWYYSVTSGSSPNVSHSAFGVPACATITDSGTWGFPDKTDLNSGDGNPTTGTDPTTGISGIKFDEATAAGTTNYYYFSLDGNYAIGHITAGVKAGPNEELDQINGPNATCSVPTPDLRIVKTDSVSSVPEGSNFAYTLTVHNDGDTTINSFTISETVPANTTFNAGGTGGGAWSCADNSPAGTSCSASGGPLDPGDSQQFTFPLTVNELWSPDPVTGLCPTEPQDPAVNNTGSVSYTGDGDDATPGNNSDSEGTPINVACQDNPATLTIVKDTVPDTQGVSFDFAGSSSEDGFNAFTLVTGAGGGASQSFTLPGGNYSVSETGLPTGWVQIGATCDGGNTIGDIDLAPGESVSCTFTNRKDGQIRVAKETLPDGSDQEFEFTRSWSSNITLGDGDSLGSAFLTPGPYTVSELVPAGWDLQSIVCDDNNGSISVATATASIQLDAGETVVCTFTNRELEPGITITKDDGGITAPEGTSFSYSLDYENTGELELTNVTITDTVPANTTFNPGASTAGWNCVPDNSAGSVCTINVGTVAPAGTGSVTFALDVDELWEPDSETGLCPEEPQGPRVNNTGSIVGDSVNGQTDDSDSDTTPIDVSCTDNPATLTIVKDTVPDTEGVSFDFTGSSSEDGFNAFTLVTDAGGDASQSFDLPGGIYNVNETVPFGWSLTSATCDGGNTIGNIDLTPGEDVTCTFTNTALDAEIAILKRTNGDESNPGQCIGIPVTESVNWTYEVTNPGDVPIDVQSIVDDAGTPGVPGDDFSPSFTGGDTNGNNLLDTDETWTYAANDTAGDFDPYTNTVSVEGVASDGSTLAAKAAVGDPVSDSDDSCYEGLTPAIDIVKSDGGITVPEGTSFAYSLDYENTGELDLTDVTLSETIPANTTFDGANNNDGWSCTGTAAGQTCTVNVGGLAVGATGSVSFPLTVDELWEPDSETGLCPEEPQGPQVNNTGSIVGQSDGGQADDSDSDSTPISVACDPNLATLTIVKETNPATQGVSFDFTGSSSEDGFNAFTLVTGAGGNASQSFELPGGNYNVSESGVAAGWELDSTSCTGGNTVGSIDLAPGESVTCTFVNRALEAELSVIKSTNGQPGEGEVCQIIEIDEPVQWTYDVTNPGEQPLTIVSIIDDNGTPGDTGDDFTPTLLSDGNGDSVLDPNETWTYEANGTAIGGEYINTVTVTAEVAGGQQPAQAKATPGTLIERSATSRYCGQQVDLAIEKTDGGLLLVAEGGTFAYTLSYENLGNVDLTGVVITETVPVNTQFSAADSTAGWSCADGAPAGTSCTFNVGSLAAGATGSVDFGLQVLELVEPDPETGECPTDPPDFKVDNTASIVDDGSNGDDANPANNEDSDDTPIATDCEDQQQSASIQIVKSPDDQLIEQGGTANFTITVTNNGDADLVNVIVDDPLSPDCDRNIGNLASGASFAYNCERNVVTAPFTNVAEVTGETETGSEVSDEDDARVRLLSVDEPEQMHPIPTMSQWGLILMAGLMLMLGVRRAREWTRR